MNEFNRGPSLGLGIALCAFAFLMHAINDTRRRVIRLETTIAPVESSR